MRPHPWLDLVHSTLLKEGVGLTCREIVERFGEAKTARLCAADRLSMASARGWFSVSLAESGKYIYKAKPRTNIYFEWTPKHDALLIANWAERGIKCRDLFPGATDSAIKSRVDVLNRHRPDEEKLKRKFKAKRTGASEQPKPQAIGTRDGLPMVASIFHLAQALEAA